MKKKGFTLIELLAVIVILAVIALIAAPAVLNIIDDARQSSAERSTEALVEATKTYYLTTIAKTGVAPTTFDSTTVKVDHAPSTYGSINVSQVDGVPEVTVTGAKFGDYTCSYQKENNKFAAKCSK